MNRPADSSLHRHSYLYVAFATTCPILLIYALTLSNSVGWHDSAELAITAQLLGASHAPGSPLHSLLGHLFTLVFAEAHIATTVMSMLAATIAALLLAWIVLGLTSKPWLAVLSALGYALSYQVWASAVVTEVYSLGMVFLGLTLLLAIRATLQPGAGILLAVTLCYSLSLAAYFANIILWPIFAWLIWLQADQRLRALFMFVVITGVAILLIAVANWLLAKNALPFGAIKPEDPMSIFLYMSGAQHEPLQIRTFAVWGQRLLEHAEIFLRSTAYLSIMFAGLGFYTLRKLSAPLGYFLGGVFVFYIGYYTFFGSGDYYLMVVPAYFVFFIWVGLGADWLANVTYGKGGIFISSAVLLTVLSYMLLTQFEGRRAMSRDQSSEEFAGISFEHLPEGALAILGYRELTALSYYQVLEQQRTDLQFILPARTPRYYMQAFVTDYVPYVANAVCTRPVFTLKELPDWQDVEEAPGVLGQIGWWRLTPDDC